MPKRFWLIVSAALALAYIGYVMWSKFAKTIGAPPFQLGEVGEFLLFLAAMAAFTLQVIVAEQRDAPARTDDISHH